MQLLNKINFQSLINADVFQIVNQLINSVRDFVFILILQAIIGFSIVTMKLSVNLNKISLLRESRGGVLPSFYDFAKIALDQDIVGLTLHPRPDQRHIIEDDIKTAFELIKQYKKLFKIEGINLEFTDCAINEIVAQAMARGTGARGLRAIIETSMMEIMYNVPSMKDVDTCSISAEVIKGKKQPSICLLYTSPSPRDRQKSRMPSSA